jgi:hypothetical protein
MAVIISLLVTLLFIVRQFDSDPVPAPAGERTPAKTRPEPLPGADVDLWQSPVVRVVPEVHDGYLFVEERKLEESDAGEGPGGDASEETLAGLEQLFYAGSLIVGETRQALVSFQETSRPNVKSVREARRGARPPAPREIIQHKLLVPGDRFLGYQVVAVEPDKIVFEKGGEKVDKFLFDQNKKRPVVATGSRAAPGQAQTPNIAQSAGSVLVVPPAVTTPAPPPDNPPPAVRIVPADQDAKTAAPEAPTRRLRRSQRLLRENTPPGLPMLPDRSAPQEIN